MKSIIPCLLFILPLSVASGNEAFLTAEQLGDGYGETALGESEPAITESDLKRFVSKLASDEFEGRGTGDPGERMATAYFAAFLKNLGLRPEGEDASFYQNFKFRAGMELKGDNSLTIEENESESPERRSLKPGDQYQPLSFSNSGKIDAEVVFAGFGIEHEGYNSFEGLDVKGKWLLVLRGSPSGNDDLKRYAPLITKARIAKKKEAAGILFVKAANPSVGPELIPPTMSVGASNTILPAITLSDELASTFFPESGCDGSLETVFESYDKGERITGFPIPFQIRTEIGLVVDHDPGRNVLGRLVVGDQPSDQVVVIGGHIDHLGYGNRGATRAKGEEAKKLHPGADDNASGIAAIMEMAQFFANQRKLGKLDLKHDLVFAAWSGEEVGLWGSRHYITEARKVTDKKVYPGVAAYINLDMVGRPSKKGLTLNGTGSSHDWKTVLDSIPPMPEVKLKRAPNPYVPSDATSFYQAGVPILAAFTGTHDDYHTPRDTVDKIEFGGLAEVTTFLKDVAVALASRTRAPEYVHVPRNRGGGATPKVRIGIRMDDIEGEGVRIAEVSENSPASKAGFQAEDVLLELNGVKIKNVQGLFGELRKLKPETEYGAVLKRGDEEVKVKIFPEARQ